LDVFVIPIGRDRYELYCEPPPEVHTAPVTPARGMIARAKQKIADLLRRAEDLHRNGPREPAAGWFARLNERMLAWIAERIAEQRLLWNLRQQTAATLIHPDDLPFAQAYTLLQRTLQRDFDRHQRWVWIDGLLFLVTFVALAPIFILIPGVANIPAIYFGFRTVGHWFSKGGAKHGLRRVQWSGRPSEPLTRLREAAGLPVMARDLRVHEVAAQLRLDHLPKFYERVSIAV
jgi:hypothetical protein